MKNILLLIFILLFSITACKKHDTLVPEFVVRAISSEQVELIRAFSGLTNNDESACNLIFDTAEIPDILCRIMKEAREGSEVVFLVDNTTSMIDDIDEVKRNINEIINCLPEGVRIAAATYGDKADGANWFNYTQLTEDRQHIKNYINAITLVGGGFDLPESVYDGIWETLDVMEWKDCKAPDKIIVMGDAAPHTGSKTTYTLEDVLAKAKSICDDTQFIPVIILDI